MTTGHLVSESVTWIVGTIVGSVCGVIVFLALVWALKMSDRIRRGK